MINKSVATVEYDSKELKGQENVGQPKWQWITLLFILGYEAAGSLVGGSLLLIAPDGRLMDMPVDMMHGIFSDFLIPGIVLFGLGILNAVAFVSVVRRNSNDWFLAGLALGGMAVWFVVEIIILKELHWLHLMWGFPVLIGYMMAIPLAVHRHRTVIMEKALLTCGILSSLWYLAINILVPMQYEGYNMVSMTVSELSAIGAPTRVLWVLLALLYPILLTAFGWGVWQLAGRKNRPMRITGGLIIVYSLISFIWPPMHQREVIAAGGGTLTDILHIVWAMMTLLFMMLMMGFGAASLGKRFRLYTIATFVVFIVFGVLIGVEAPGINANLPTPRIGVWERINIGAFMLWVMVFAIVLLRVKKMPGSIDNRRVI